MSNTARHDFARADYPITIEALHPDTRVVVWSVVVEAPAEGTRTVSVPPLRKQLGHPVIIRIRYADGRVQESAPPPEVQ